MMIFGRGCAYKVSMTDSATPSIERLMLRPVLWWCLGLAACISLIVFATIAQLGRAEIARTLGIQAAMVARLAEQKDGNMNIDPATLQSWQVNPQLRAACIVDKGGQMLAAVGGQQVSSPEAVQQLCREAAGRAGGPHGLTTMQVDLFVTNPAFAQPMGRMILVGESDLSLTRVLFSLASGIALSGVVAAVFLRLASNVRSRTETPLMQIASAAQRVSIYKDYSLRLTSAAAKQYPAEVASVMESVNTMLVELEDRNQRLLQKTEELQKAREVAEAANSAKSNFLANISHELRTPLNAVIGFSTMMSAAQFGPLGHPKYEEYARDIHDSGVHLMDLINDILDLSRAESGTLSVHLEMVSIQKIIEKALHIIEGQAMERRIDIYTDIQSKLPKIVADKVRLMQIFLNLLSNALKFTKEGGRVVVHVRAESGLNNVQYFDIAIEDNGIGMTRTQLATIFENFNQLDAGLNRKSVGAGLGLPLTKKLVELHHGRISIESEPEKGTIVTVRLPSDPALLD